MQRITVYQRTGKGAQLKDAVGTLLNLAMNNPHGQRGQPVSGRYRWALAEKPPRLPGGDRHHLQLLARGSKPLLAGFAQGFSDFMLANFIFRIRDLFLYCTIIQSHKLFIAEATDAKMCCTTNRVMVLLIVC